MKFRISRDEYCVDAVAIVMIVSVNDRLATVIIDPAIAVSIPRAPSAPTPNKRGNRAAQSYPTTASAAIRPLAIAIAAATMVSGTNHRLDLIAIQIECRELTAQS